MKSDPDPGKYIFLALADKVVEAAKRTASYPCPAPHICENELCAALRAYDEGKPVA